MTRFDEIHGPIQVSMVPGWFRSRVTVRNYREPDAPGATLTWTVWRWQGLRVWRERCAAMRDAYPR